MDGFDLCWAWRLTTKTDCNGGGTANGGRRETYVPWRPEQIERMSATLSRAKSGVVQLVARQPLELVILVRVQAPEPFFTFLRTRAALF
jgi:hypothetical protein